jgi:copper chaperone CopZ
MDFNTTVDLIIKDLNEAREIIDDLRNYPGVPSLQVELAKSKCKSAAEVIALLKNIQGQPVAEAKKKPEASRPSFVINADEIPSNKKKVTESAIVADTFSHLPNSLNEQLGNLRDDNDVSDILKTKPLTNLSDAIGVNDKFLFIRELFNGNPESYNQAISKLDNAASLADAKAVIMSYTDNDAENEAVRQLLDLVKRKFPVDE